MWKVKIMGIKRKIGRLLEVCILRDKKSVKNAVNSWITPYKNINKNIK